MKTLHDTTGGYKERILLKLYFSTKVARKFPTEKGAKNDSQLQRIICKSEGAIEFLLSFIKTTPGKMLVNFVWVNALESLSIIIVTQ